MCYAEPVILPVILNNHLRMNDKYQDPKQMGLSEKELMGLRIMKSMGNKEATQKLADYYLNLYFCN